MSLDGEVLTESGYVISRLVKGNRSSHLEEFNHTSEFWSHFSEGSFACGIMSSVLLGVNAQGWTSQTKPGQEGKLTLDSFLSFYLVIPISRLEGRADTVIGWAFSKSRE